MNKKILICGIFLVLLFLLISFGCKKEEEIIFPPGIVMPELPNHTLPAILSPEPVIISTVGGGVIYVTVLEILDTPEDEQNSYAILKVDKIKEDKIGGICIDCGICVDCWPEYFKKVGEIKIGDELIFYFWNTVGPSPWSPAGIGVGDKIKISFFGVKDPPKKIEGTNLTYVWMIDKYVFGEGYI